MVKTRKLLVAAAALFAAVFMGCSMLSDASVSTEGTATVYSGNMTGTIVNFGDYVSSTRTILPTDTLDADEYDWYLYGHPIVGEDFPITKLDSSKFADVPKDGGGTVDGQKKFTIPMVASAWDFTLFAVEKGADVSSITKDNISENAAFVAYAFADLTNDTSAVTFKLSPDGCTGNGNVQFDIYLQNDPSDENTKWTVPTGYKVEAEIQDFITGETVNWDGGATTSAIITFPDSKTTFGTPSPLKPGTYNFIVTFIDSNDKVQGVWSDTLVVVTQRTTDSDVFIPNLLGLKPLAVTSLKAQYVVGSEDSLNHVGEYKVHFTWDAAAVKNERWFEFQIADVSTDITTDTFTDGASTDPGEEWVSGIQSKIAYKFAPKASGSGASAISSFNSSSIRVDGSLLANNTDLTVWLPLGKAYTARIRAVNDLGTSVKDYTNNVPAWTYVTLPTAAAAAADNSYTAAQLAPFAVGDTPEACSSINRFRVTYMLNNGKSDTITQKQGKLVVFNMQKSLGTRVVTPLWDAAADNLVYGTQKFAYWTDAVNVNWDSVERAKHLVYGAKVGVSEAGAASTLVRNLTKTTAAYATAGLLPTSTNIAKPASLGFKEDDGGYSGLENITLYADYTGDFSGIIDTNDIDPISQYKFDASHVKLATTTNSTAVAIGAATYSSASKTISKVAEGTATAGKVTKCELSFSVDLSAATTNKSSYDKFYIVVSTASGKIMKTETVSGGSATASFAAVEVKNWENGQYKAEIKALKGTNIERKVTFNFALED